MQLAFLYNPGLKSSWFVVTGVFGLTLLVNASLVAETTMIRERERGTIEQLSQADRERVEEANLTFVNDERISSIETNVLYALATKPRTVNE